MARFFASILTLFHTLHKLSVNPAQKRPPSTCFRCHSTVNISILNFPTSRSVDRERDSTVKPSHIAPGDTVSHSSISHNAGASAV